MTYKINKKILFTVLSVIIIAFVFWSSVTLQSLFYDSVGFLGKYIEQNRILGILIFMGLAAVSALFSPFSSVPLIPAGIMIWGGNIVFFLLTSGWLLGDLIAYSIGRFARRAVISRFVPQEKLDYYKEIISKKARFWFVLLFRFALPSEITGYALGIMRYHFGKYLLVTVLVEIPFAFLTVYSGEAFVKGNLLLFTSLVLFSAAVIYLTLYYFKKKLKDK
ncbi:VTT domain-containing protein [Patescibacteria group bacterium]|nr:VTT domain-containing protein [Patescibacteria group bacterium]MBU4347645.1 VTT domain-containing protein [Patescibacteria group bacterium]